MSDRPPGKPATPPGARPAPTIEFRTDPELTDAVARALLTLLQRSSASSRQGPVESTEA